MQSCSTFSRWPYCISYMDQKLISFWVCTNFVVLLLDFFKAFYIILFYNFYQCRQVSEMMCHSKGSRVSRESEKRVQFHKLQLQPQNHWPLTTYVCTLINMDTVPKHCGLRIQVNTDRLSFQGGFTALCQYPVYGWMTWHLKQMVCEWQDCKYAIGKVTGAWSKHGDPSCSSDRLQRAHGRSHSTAARLLLLF